jgi:hypothetical protein
VAGEEGDTAERGSVSEGRTPKALLQIRSRASREEHEVLAMKSKSAQRSW